MKILYLSAILFLLPKLLFSQNSENNYLDAWSIDLNIASEQTTSFGNFVPTSFNGFLLKKHFKNFNVRFGLDNYHLIDKDALAECCDQIATKGYQHIKMLKFGIEKHPKWNTIILPFYAVDIAGFQSQTWQMYSGGITNQYGETKSSKYGAGLLPTLGLHITLNSKFSINIESKFGIFYERGKTVTTDLTIPNLPTQYITNKPTMDIKRISLVFINYKL